MYILSLQFAYLNSAFLDSNRCKAALQKVLVYKSISLYLVVVSVVKLTSIWQKCTVKIMQLVNDMTVNTINSNYFMLRSNL